MRNADALIVLALFAAARLLYGAAGVHFDASTFPAFMQFIDRPLLETRLLESLWFSHAQPPLLNLYTGIGFKVFGDAAPVFFAATFHLLGYGLALCVFALVARLAESRMAAHCAVVALVFSPAFVLYENWFMYTFPTAVLLAAAALALLHYLDGKRTRKAVLFFSLLAALLLLRSLFHLLWLAAVVVMLVALLPGQRRQVLVAAAAPVALVVLWYGKNLLYFGTFGASTALGLSLTNVTTLTLTRDELAPLVVRGELSPLALVSRYTETDKLFALASPEPTGIPVLDEVRKETGDFNYNHRSMIEVNRLLTRDAVTVAAKFPCNYAVAVLIANKLYFSPSSMNEYFSAENRAAAAPLERALTPVLYGVSATPRYLVQPHFGFGGQPSLEVDTSVPLIVAWLLVMPLANGIARSRFTRGTPAERNGAVVIGFMLLTTLYAYAMSTALELAENYRYKFLVEPLVLVLAATVVVAALRLARRTSRP
jgi:hypothetical protein